MLQFLMQHGGAKVGNFLTLVVNHTGVIAFFLFTDTRIATDKILFSIPCMRNIIFYSSQAQYRNLIPAVVQIAYTFSIILCQEWNRAIMCKYQSILH